LRGADVIGGVNGKMTWQRVSGGSLMGRRVVSGSRETSFWRGGGKAVNGFTRAGSEML